jgi:hypothetical protein
VGYSEKGIERMIPLKELAIGTRVEFRKFVDWMGYASAMGYHLDSKPARQPGFCRMRRDIGVVANVSCPARGYISSIAMALRTYLEYFVQLDFDRSQNDEDFVYVHQTWMNKVPYLTEHSANAFMLSNFLMMYQPALKAMRLAGLAASAMVLGKSLFKEGALEKMKKELEESGAPIPAIAEDL